MSYDFLIPATRSTATITLLAAVMQTKRPDRIIVRDVSGRLTRLYEFRQAVAIAKWKGIPVSYVHGEPGGIRADRIALGRLSTSEWMFWADDDTVPEPRAVEECFRMPGECVTCRTPTANDEWGGDYCPPDGDVLLWSYGYLGIPREDMRAGLNATLIHSLLFPRMVKAWEEHEGDEAFEDLQAWTEIGAPLVCPSAVSWEMKHPEGRAWEAFTDSAER